MASQPNTYPLWLNEILAKKIKTLAKLNDRSYKGLKKYIAEYEKENGEIIIDPDE